MRSTDYLDPRALAARNPWFAEEPYRSRRLTADQQDRMEHALDDDLPDVMDQIAAELDAEAETMIPYPLPPEFVAMRRLVADLFKGFGKTPAVAWLTSDHVTNTLARFREEDAAEREVPVPVSHEPNRRV